MTNIRKTCWIPAVMFLGCGVPPGFSALDGGSQEAVDQTRYAEFATRLASARTPFRGKKSDEHRAVGSRVYWLEGGSFIPTLMSQRLSSGSPVSYGFSISVDGSNYDYQASDEMIATVEARSNDPVYRTYRASEPNERLAELKLPKPPSGERYYPYSVDRQTVYLLDTHDGTLLSWQPPALDTTVVLRLAEAGIANVGEVLGLTVSEGRAALIESGRLWMLDLTTRKATWVRTETEVSAGGWSAAGVYAQTATGKLFVPTGSSVARDVTAELQMSPFALTPTHDRAHHDSGEEAFLHHDQLLYIGNSGVFEYNLGKQQIRPVLLEPFDAEVRVEYRQPQVTSDGTLIILGLESTSGSVGAEGPLFSLSLSAVPSL